VGTCTRGRCDQQGCNAEWRRAFFFFFTQTKKLEEEKKGTGFHIFFFFTEFAEKMTQKKKSKVFELFERCSRIFVRKKKGTSGQCRDSDTGSVFFVSQFHREQITIDSSRVSGNISRGDKGIAGMEANGKKK
jgi:hypothetical protein